MPSSKLHSLLCTPANDPHRSTRAPAWVGPGTIGLPLPPCREKLGGWHPPPILYAPTPKAGTNEPKGVDLFAEDNPFMQTNLSSEWIRSIPSGEKAVGTTEETAAAPGTSTLTATSQHGTKAASAPKPARSRERTRAGQHQQDVVPWAVQENVVSLPVATGPSDSGQFMGAKWKSPRRTPHQGSALVGNSLTGSYSLPPDDPNLHPSLARARMVQHGAISGSPPPTRLLAPPSSPMTESASLGLNGNRASATRGDTTSFSPSQEPASPDHAAGAAQSSAAARQQTRDERASPSMLPNCQPNWCEPHPSMGVPIAIPSPLLGGSYRGTHSDNAHVEVHGCGALGSTAFGVDALDSGAAPAIGVASHETASYHIPPTPLPHVITPSRRPPRPPPPPPQLATRRIGLSYVAKGPTGGAFYWGRPKLPPALRPPPEQAGVWHPKAAPLRPLTPRSPREILLLGGQHGGAESRERGEPTGSRGWAARQLALGGMSNWNR